jgi:hypothetical protein
MVYFNKSTIHLLTHTLFKALLLCVLEVQFIVEGDWQDIVERDWQDIVERDWQDIVEGTGRIL